MVDPWLQEWWKTKKGCSVEQPFLCPGNQPAGLLVARVVAFGRTFVFRLVTPHAEGMPGLEVPFFIRWEVFVFVTGVAVVLGLMRGVGKDGRPFPRLAFQDDNRWGKGGMVSLFCRAAFRAVGGRVLKKQHACEE